MQIQSLNANPGGASTVTPTLTSALANESVGGPLPKPVFEAILAELANPSSESFQNLNSPDQTSGVFGKVYAPETLGEADPSINAFPIDYLPLQSLANNDLSPASTNLTNAFMFSLSPNASSQQNGSQKPISSAPPAPQATPQATSLINPAIDSGISAGKSLFRPNEGLARPSFGHHSYPSSTQATVDHNSTAAFNSIATNQTIDQPITSVNGISSRQIEVPQTSTEPAPTDQKQLSIAKTTVDTVTGVRLNPSQAPFARSTSAAPINPPENPLLADGASPIRNTDQPASTHFEYGNFTRPSPGHSISGRSIPDHAKLGRSIPGRSLSNESSVTDSAQVDNDGGSSLAINAPVNATQTISSTHGIDPAQNQTAAVSPIAPSIRSPQNVLSIAPSVVNESPSQPSNNGQNLEPLPIPALAPITSQVRPKAVATNLDEPTITQVDAVSLSESSTPIAEVASTLPDRVRPMSSSRNNVESLVSQTDTTNVKAGTSLEAEQLESTLPLQTGAPPQSAVDNEATLANFDSTEFADARVPPPVATSADLFADSLNVTDVQITAENRVASELNGSSISQFNLPAGEIVSESHVSAMNAAPEPSSDQFQRLDVGSNFELKSNSETVVRDFRLPQVAEKSISEVVSEIVAQRNVESQQGNEVTRIRIEIDPPELGEISIEISRNPHQTVATVVVANEYAQQQLGGNIQQLQTSLESLGVEFKQVEVQQQNPEQNSFDLAQRESNSQQENRERSDGNAANHSRDQENDPANRLEENTTKPISVRSVHVVDVLV